MRGRGGPPSRMPLGRCVLGWILGLLMVSAASGEQLFQLQNGLVIRGSQAEIATLKEGFGAAGANQAITRPIWLIDDGLRRTYIHGRGMVAGEPIEIGDLEQGIEIWQPQPLGGKAVAGLGNILGVSEFNDMGRRVLTVRGPEGPVEIIQGISELNSRYAKLVALKPPEGSTALSWDMRVSSRSLSTATLQQIFARRFDRNDLDARLQAVRFFIAAERFGAAKAALQEIVEDFPDEPELAAQLTALTEQQAGQLLTEAEVRAAAGQYQLAGEILSKFPVESVGRVTRIQVQDAVAKLNNAAAQGRQLIEQLRAQVSLLDARVQDQLSPIVDEIDLGLSPDTLPRLSDYARLGGVDEMPLDNRVALAIAGWLLGSGSGEQNLNIAASLIEVRALVTEYLASSDAARREEILGQLRNLEGALPPYVDRMLPLLTPVLPWPPDSAHPDIAGMHRVQTEHGWYLIQLPPEYNPLREYPCVLALHETRSDPSGQLDWWAGLHHRETGSRRGHGSRQGFIVVAPLWSRPRQRVYEYTPVEHQRVLVALRDAMRRASIDADRVFITGHGEGATAAWDMALAHPDLWAGMIAISGAPGKTVYHYGPNSQYVPMYLVMGELDHNKPAGAILDSYMTFDHDAMVVMYRGRGREYFYDEVPTLFQWMMLPSHVRRPMPGRFEVATMRRGDQFFWWLELDELNPAVAVDPILWDQAERLRAGVVSLSLGGGNLLTIAGPSDAYRVFLRPHQDFDMTQEMRIRFGNRTKRVRFDGSLAAMLEDVRQRADRKRPFWMQVAVP